jgi:hypothetical protein
MRFHDLRTSGENRVECLFETQFRMHPLERQARKKVPLRRKTKIYSGPITERPCHGLMFTLRLEQKPPSLITSA